MAARRQSILTAARRCFARKGFHATTIADLCREAGVSAGGLYTYFESKHAVVAALGSDATAGGDVRDLLELYRALQAPEGRTAAQLDLHLWAASSSDDRLADMVHESFDAFRESLQRPGRSEAQIALLEAIALGVEVQRALGRPVVPDFEEHLRSVVEGTSV